MAAMVLCASSRTDLRHVPVDRRSDNSGGSAFHAFAVRNDPGTGSKMWFVRLR